MSAGILSAKVLTINPNMTPAQKVEANSQAILRVTDGAKWLCVCSSDAMTALFGTARSVLTYTVEGSQITFCNVMDSPGWYVDRGN